MQNRRPPRNRPFDQRTHADRGRRGPLEARGARRGDVDGNRAPARANRHGTPPTGNDRRTRGFYKSEYPRVQDSRVRPTRRGKFSPADRSGPKFRGGGERRGAIRSRANGQAQITSDLQITDGKYRARFFESSSSPNAAPTPRKLREIMFKILSRRIKARRFLDLGAGAGCVGLEALSRGAMVGTFVERSARMCTLIKKNLASLGIKDGHGELCEAEILPFLKRAALRHRRWDIVYIGTRDAADDPQTFGYFSRGIPVAPGGLLMIEHASSREYPERMGLLQRWRTIANDGSTITFFERR